MVLGYTNTPWKQLTYIGAPLSMLILSDEISLTDTTRSTVIELPDNCTFNGTSLMSMIYFGSVVNHVVTTPAPDPVDPTPDPVESPTPESPANVEPVTE